MTVYTTATHLPLLCFLTAYYYYYYYQFYLLGTGRFHKKAEPVIMSPKPKGSLLESNGVGHY